jgi:hypothetical protein
MINKDKFTGIKITESKLGHLEIGCEISGRPLTRTNEYGMFCDAEVCECEQKSKKIGEDVFCMNIVELG